MLNYGYENYEAKLQQCIEHNKTLPPAKPPRPLHRSFYNSVSSTTNREQERHAIRHSRKHRITCRTDKANRIKRQVKTIRMRNSVDKTISQILKFPSLYTLAARDLHQAEAVRSRSSY